ncbi:M56 family metallopeptidase [Dyadobacter sp. CY345]|uniref:M56 family metallopeptidase n=1 Tax=Dyadobacter sp. CY345 TaxID=2909335 RepID=UPI001F3E3134|nr:M56 family metallopeptidase [Dyadobacter sp. CY345]MCF2446901.1 M56 family metallopeptidase [Dyadobacter sp. CY345]
MDYLIYAGKVNLYWILFYGCYWLFFRKFTFFGANRYYLITTLLIALILPVFTFTYITQEIVPQTVMQVSSTQLIDGPVSISEPVTGLTDYFFIVYLSGVVLMISKLMHGLYQIFRLSQKGELIETENYKMVLLPDSNSRQSSVNSCSFLFWMFVSRHDYEHNLDTIIRHEYVHIAQRHSYDILLIEVLKAFFWFNPILWFYKYSLQEVHEFLADKGFTDRDRYASFLISYASKEPGKLLTNRFFNPSLLKNRVQMMYKNRTSSWSGARYLFVIPIAGMMLLLTAAKEKTIPASPVEMTVLSEDVISVKGRITDQAGNAISGASIKIKNSSKVSKSDVAGVFELTDVPLKSIIIVSHPRFSGEEFKISKPKPYYRIVLKSKGDQVSSLLKTERYIAKSTGLIKSKEEKEIESYLTKPLDNSRKKDYRKPYYYNAAVLVKEVDPTFPTIREIGKYLNKAIDFSADQPQPANYPSIVAYEKLAPSIYRKPDAVRFGIRGREAY